MELALKELEQIKKLAIISVFSDDTLMNTLVLKGGNALDIIYKIALKDRNLEVKVIEKDHR